MSLSGLSNSGRCRGGSTRNSGATTRWIRLNLSKYRPFRQPLHLAFPDHAGSRSLESFATLHRMIEIPGCHSPGRLIRGDRFFNGDRAAHSLVSSRKGERPWIGRCSDMNLREFLDHQSDHSARLRTQHVRLGPHREPVVLTPPDTASPTGRSRKIDRVL